MDHRRKLVRGDTVLWSDELSQTELNKEDERSKFAAVAFKAFHILSARKPELADGIFSSHVKFTRNSNPPMDGLNSAKAAWVFVHDHTEDLHFIIDDIIIEGTLKEGKVAVKHHYTATWTKGYGEFAPSASTKDILVPGISIMEAKDGLIVSWIMFADYGGCRTWEACGASSTSDIKKKETA